MKSPKKFAGAIINTAQNDTPSVVAETPQVLADVLSEKLILGTLMSDEAIKAEKTFREVSFLKSEFFFDAKHRIIYTAIEELNMQGSAYDELLVAARLKQSSSKTAANLLEEVGGAAYLETLKKEAAKKREYNMLSHARLVMRYASQREAIDILESEIKNIKSAKLEAIFDLRAAIADKLRTVSDSEYLVAKSADQDLKDADDEPEMRMLIDSLLFENTIGALFAPSGIGKSIFAVQVGYNIANGLDHFEYIDEETGEVKCLFRNEAKEGLKVGFVDLELSKAQFKKRYSSKNSGENHKFGDNFIRISVDRNSKKNASEGREQAVFRSIENNVAANKIKVLILDNITKLSPEAKTDPVVIQRIIQFLEYLRDKYGLTVLVIAHTPKRVNNTQPITKYDMSGSVILSDLLDTVFALNIDNNDPNLIYLKQVKSRDEVNQYDSDNVARFTITRSHADTFLCYSYQNSGDERDHLADFMKKETQDALIEEAILLKIKEPRKGWRTLAADLNYNQSHITLKNRMIAFAKKSNLYSYETTGDEVIFKNKGSRATDNE